MAFAVTANTSTGFEISLGAPNTPPTVALNSPADLATGLSTTPTLEFTGTDADSDDIRYNVQVDTSSGFGGVATYYFDASDSGPTDASAGWTNDANAFDGSTATDAYGDGTSGRYLIAGGTTAPTSGANITQVRIRVGGIPTGGFVYSSYITLTVPFGGWTWAKVNDLVVRINTSFNNVIPDVYEGADTGFTTSLGLINVNMETSVAIVQLEVTTDPLLNKISNTDAGFANTVTPADTDPFTSGEMADYDVQAGDALSTGTYYWRVRGLDPTGTNTYGAWSSTRSFEVTGATPINWGKIKVAGTFVDILDRRFKVGGTFVSAVGYKIKVSGTFVDLV